MKKTKLFYFIAIVVLLTNQITAHITDNDNKINDLCSNPSMKRKTIKEQINFDLFLNDDLTNVCVILMKSQSLNTTIIKSGLKNFTLVGTVDDAITCINDNASIGFIKSENIRLINIQFTGCGGKHKSFMMPPRNETDTPTISTALYFLQTKNIFFKDITITKSKGYGLVLYNCYDNLNFDTVVISKGQLAPYMVIKNGTAVSIPGYGSGGGLYLEYTKDSLAKYNTGNIM